MVVSRWFCLLALRVSVETVRQPEEETAAGHLVNTLLKERSNSAIAQVAASSNGFFQWVLPASVQTSEKALKEAEQEVRAEFEEVLGKDLISVFEQDFAAIRKDLEITDKALPRTDNGQLGHTAVRYALHRLFVARHGWYIQGLDPAGNHFNATSPAEVLKGRVPHHVQVFTEKLLHGRGFGLSEVAMLGALLENLVHKEAIERTRAVFAAYDMDTDNKASAKDVDFAIDHYMATYILGPMHDSRGHIRKVTKHLLDIMYAGMSKAYPTWEYTRGWTHSIRHHLYGDKDLTFDETGAVIVDIGEKHGTWQTRECLDLKAMLMELEVQKDGCVPLSNFYKSLKDGKWQFSESPDYLRELGVLDESDPENVRVMIPNYLDSASNCVASSEFYSVCCVNECDALLRQIEEQIQNPDASSQDLASLVAAMPSKTMPADRTLSAALLTRLEKIAISHGGRVPIHSRLFMQWMHNAYPHECPYPYVSGRTTQRSPEHWMADTHKSPTVTEAEAAGFAKKAAAAMPHGHGQCGQWTNQEELYVPWKDHKDRDATSEMDL